MEAKAHVKYLRMSPRKVKILCDLIRGKDVKTATAYIMQTPKAASEPMLKAPEECCCKRGEQPQHGRRATCTSPRRCANPGPTLKRGMPRAQGRYNRILKRTTHITIGVSEKDLSRRLAMGQKVNPHGLRVGVIKDWDSRWYARER